MLRLITILNDDFSFSLFLMSDFWSIVLYCRFFLCSFSSSSSVGSGTRFWLVAPSGSSTLATSYLRSLVRYILNKKFLFEFECLILGDDNASFELSARMDPVCHRIIWKTMLKSGLGAAGKQTAIQNRRLSHFHVFSFLLTTAMRIKLFFLTVAPNNTSHFLISLRLIVQASYCKY